VRGKRRASRRQDRLAQPAIARDGARAVPARRTILVSLALGLALLAAGVAATLSQRAVRWAATNDVTAGETLLVAPAAWQRCQDGEHVPARTATVSVSLAHLSPTPPRIEVRVIDRAGVRARGSGGARWGRHAVLVPLRAPLAAGVDGRVCIRLAPTAAHQRVRVLGQNPEAGEEGEEGEAPQRSVQSGRLRFDYLYAAKSSWWAFAGTVLQRMGRAHIWSGRSVGLAAALLSLAAIALAVWQLLRRAPRGAVACALVAVANAAAWSLIMPAFQVPDEQAHYAYAEYLAQHGQVPAPAFRDVASSSQQLALTDLDFEATRFHASNKPPWSQEQQDRLERDLAFDAGRGDGNGGAYTFGGEPALFYALQTIPYRIAAGGTVLDRLQLMRLLDVLLAGATVGFVYLFLREALPASPWTWGVGALAVAFQPMFASISGGMNSDALLFATAAALFWLLARAFRRGLTRRLALAIGAAMAVGVLTKFNFAGLVPGVALGLAAVALRGADPRATRLRALRLPALALGICAGAALAQIALNVAWGRPATGASGSAFFSLTGVHLSLGRGLSYLAQFYVVGLPGLTHYLGSVPLADTWVLGFVGTFGWVDTFFRPLVAHLALVPLGAVAAGAAAALVRGRERVRARRPELLVYGVMAAIFMTFVAFASFLVYTRFESSIAQVRYLFPLLALYAGALVLATRAAGRRWMPVAGCAIVVLAIAHDVFSQLLVIARYYA